MLDVKLDVKVFDFYGPPSYEQYLMRQLAQAAEAEQASPLYAAPFLNSLQKANAKSDLIIPLAEQDLCDSSSLPDLNNDQLFERLGVYLQGKPYISLSLAQRSQMYLDSDDVDEPVEPPADEDTPTWNLEFQVARYCSDSSATIPAGAVNALHEGHGSVLGFPGSLGDPASSDYLAVTLPALPDGYMANITLGGTASSSDYYVYIPYDGGSTSVTNGYVHSGDAATLYIVPIDDRVTESLETVTLSMGAPYHNDFAEPEVLYSFNNINTSVIATIVDNDDWKISVYPVVDDSELGYTLLTEEEQNEASFRVARVDAGSGYGEDKHYAIDAYVRFLGTATANGNNADYNVYLNNANGSRTLLTPSGNGVVTVQIPENELYATLTVVAKDDSIVERLYETIDISVVSALSYPLYYIDYDVSSEHVYVKIKDNDILRVSTVQFLDNLDLYCDKTGSIDFGTPWKDVTHWYRSDSTKTLPVAYSSDSTMKCQITVDGTRDSTQTYEVRMKWKRQYGTAVYSDWQEVDAFSSSVVVQLNSSFASIFGRSQAYYDLSSEIEWEFRVCDDQDRDDLGDMGTSVNPLYVTYKAPLPGAQNYLSLVHLGCAMAYSSSVTTDARVFEVLWNIIESKYIHKVQLINGSIVHNGDLLTYYGQDASNDAWRQALYKKLEVTKLTSPSGVTSYLVDQFPSLARQIVINLGSVTGNGFNVQSLLYYTDGTCGAWQDFAYSLFRIQGLAVESVDLKVKDTDNYAFKVNPALSAQGVDQPRECIWGDHALIKYNNVVYDPSYAICYGDYDNALSVFVTYLDSYGSWSKTNSYGNYGQTYEPQESNGAITISNFKLICRLTSKRTLFQRRRHNAQIPVSIYYPIVGRIPA